MLLSKAIVIHTLMVVAVMQSANHLKSALDTLVVK